MKKSILFSILLFFSTYLFSQDMKKFNLYNPQENAKLALEKKVKEAKQAGKYVFVQVGGNWCIWCARFNEFVTTDPGIDSLIHNNFVVYHLNWSKENRNEKLLTKFKFPQRFGYPVFLILDDKGDLIHTQNSVYLEEGKGYSRSKVIEFFQQWSPAAFDPAKYKDQ